MTKDLKLELTSPWPLISSRKVNVTLYYLQERWIAYTTEGVWSVGLTKREALKNLLMNQLDHQCNTIADELERMYEKYELELSNKFDV
jgi:hypothetical protein